MVVGTGIDIVEVERFRKLDHPQPFVREILTDREILTLSPGPHRYIQIATLFALKEATLKALGCGLHDGSFWHEVEFDPDGRARLSGRLASLATQQSVTTIHSSQSCSENRVVAFVVLEHNRQEVSHEQRRIVRDEIPTVSMETFRG